MRNLVEGARGPEAKRQEWESGKKMEPETEEAWLTAFFGSNAVFSLLLLTLLVVYFGSEHSVLHVRY